MGLLNSYRHVDGCQVFYCSVLNINYPKGLWGCSIAVHTLMDVKYSTVLFRIILGHLRIIMVSRKRNLILAIISFTLGFLMIT